MGGPEKFLFAVRIPSDPYRGKVYPLIGMGAFQCAEVECPPPPPRDNLEPAHHILHPLTKPEIPNQ